MMILVISLFERMASDTDALQHSQAESPSQLKQLHLIIHLLARMPVVLLRMLHQFVFNGIEERAARQFEAAPVEVSALGPGERELVLGAGHAHVEQATFLRGIGFAAVRGSEWKTPPGVSVIPPSPWGSAPWWRSP